MRNQVVRQAPSHGHAGGGETHHDDNAVRLWEGVNASSEEIDDARALIHITSECIDDEVAGGVLANKDRVIRHLRDYCAKNPNITDVYVQIWKRKHCGLPVKHNPEYVADQNTQNLLKSVFSVNVRQVSIKVVFKYIEAVTDYGAEFAEYIKAKRIDDANAAQLLNQFLAERVPEFSALESVKTLRQQLHRETVEKKPAFPGIKKAGSAIQYLLDQYGDAIRSGNLGPGQLQVRDRYLTNRVVIELGDEKLMREHFPEGELPTSLRELIGRISEKGAFVSPYDERVQACADILNTDPDQAKRFFGTLHSQRSTEKKQFSR